MSDSSVSAGLPAPFTTSSLRQAGFVGWVRFEELRGGSCPSAGGVYVVTYPSGERAAFAARSGGGWFKGQDPSVPPETLTANWVDSAEVVYIGKANQLRRRLIQYADFGAGRPVGHWGGRLIWQLPNTSDLRVAWKETPGRVPSDVEAELIASFRQVYGKPPFANAPHLMGR